MGIGSSGSVRILGWVAAAAMALPPVALAQAPPSPADTPAPATTGGAALGVVFVLVLFLIGAWVMLRRLAEEMQAKAAAAPEADQPRLATRLMELPLGVPEGSIRALLSIFIIVLGFLLLALQGPLGLGSGEALTGFIGAVISFYFAARTGEQARQVAETAADAARQAAGAADRATTAATDAGTAANTAATASTTLANSVQAGAVAPAATPEQQGIQSRLREAQGQLQSLRGLISVVGTLGVGTGALAGADRALARVDGLLDRIAPVVGGQADIGSIGRLAEEASTTIRELGDLGPVGTAVADAMATVGRVASDSLPIAGLLGRLVGSGGIAGAGALAGPAGLVAAVVVGGIGLVRDREKFDRWKAAMLDTPLDLGLLPPVVDASLAAAALLRSPPLAALTRQGAVEPALALSVWEAVQGTPPEPAASLAVRILQGVVAGPGAQALRDNFAGHPDALADAIEDFRAAMTGAAALAGLDLPQVTVAGASIPTATLATAVRAARQDSRVAAEIDRLVYMVQALGKADPAMLATVAGQLGDAGFLAKAAQEAAAKAQAAQAASTPLSSPEGGSG
jgi:hypothetical protein